MNRVITEILKNKIESKNRN